MLAPCLNCRVFTLTTSDSGRPCLYVIIQNEKNEVIPLHRVVRTLMLALLTTTLTAAEPWHAIAAPTITTQSVAAALVMLAYRMTAEQLLRLSDFSDVQVARVGAEVVVRCHEATYRLRDSDLLEFWPISDEDSDELRLSHG